MTVFNDTVTETINVPHDAGLGLEYPDTLTQGMGITPLPAAAWTFLRTLSETVNMSQTDAGLWFALREVIETVNTSEVLAQVLKYTLTQTEMVEITDLMTVGFPVDLVQALTVAPVETALPAYQILETISVADPTLPTILARMAVAETVRFTEELARYMELTIAETVNLTFTLVAVGKLYASQTENVTITHTLVGLLQARAVVEETVEITQLDALKAIFSPILVDGIELDGIWVQPDGSFTTWAINSNTGAVSEYTNYVFNSFAMMGDKYIAAASDGLYELLGNTDQGAAIIARFGGGMMNLGDSKYSSFKAAYIGLRDNGAHNDVYLKLVTGDGKTYVYKVQSKTMETTKVHFGKGLRARYFSYELYTVGQDFDFDMIEFVPIVNQRRT